MRVNALQSNLLSQPVETWEGEVPAEPNPFQNIDSRILNIFQNIDHFIVPGQANLGLSEFQQADKVPSRLCCYAVKVCKHVDPL